MTNPKPQPLEERFKQAKPHSVIEVTDDEFAQLRSACASVDSRSKAVLAAEEFAACEIRCHMLHGQWLAELDHLKELSLALDQERDAAVKRVQEAGR